MVYDLIYSDKNYKAEAYYVSGLIQKYMPGAKDILELGCGTGGHGIYMASDYNIFGIDLDKNKIDEAKKKGYNCQVGDICKYKVNNKYHVVISLFHVISYITKNDDLINLFNNTYKNLNQGGLFIFDVWYTPAVYYLKPEQRIKKVGDVIRFASPTVYYNDNVVAIDYDFITDVRYSEHHEMRHFSIPEIDLLARFTGFELIKAEEFLTGNKPSTNTWGVNFILRRCLL